MAPLYVFDSSIWIRFNKHHPADIFVSLWDRIDDSVKNGELISPVDVHDELAEGTDGLAKELKQRDGLFIPLDEDMLTAVQEVMAECPTLADPESEKNRADPFVVALAKLRDGVVVTGERPRKAPTGRQKIPDACDRFGIRSLGWFDFLREKQWKV